MSKIALAFGADLPDNKRQFYRDALQSVGLQAADDPSSMDGMAGLLLAGGGDVDPALYGAERHPETQPPDHALDALESRLAREALGRDMPILAICRGQQLLNVVCGGTLTQHIEGHKSTELDAHMVDIAPGSFLASILKAGSYSVNTSHHQCVDKVGNGLVVSARDPEGIIEALEFPDKRFVVAVQWHPERRIHGTDARLFQFFRDSITNRGSQ